MIRPMNLTAAWFCNLPQKDAAEDQRLTVVEFVHRHSKMRESRLDLLKIEEDTLREDRRWMHLKV